MTYMIFTLSKLSETVFLCQGNEQELEKLGGGRENPPQTAEVPKLRGYSLVKTCLLSTLLLNKPQQDPFLQQSKVLDVLQLSFIFRIRLLEVFHKHPLLPILLLVLVFIHHLILLFLLSIALLGVDYTLEGSLVEVVDVAVIALLQTGQQLLLDIRVQFRRNKSLLFSPPLSTLRLPRLR